MEPKIACILITHLCKLHEFELEIVLRRKCHREYESRCLDIVPKFSLLSLKICTGNNKKYKNLEPDVVLKTQLN